MSDLDILERALGEVAAGTRVPYLGPGVSALSNDAVPMTPEALCARIEAEVRAPRRASGNLWSVAQYVESRKFRATLNDIVERAFDAAPTRANPVHDWLARVAPPLIVDTWYDDGLLDTFTTANWGLIQGVSRNGEWIDIFTRAYDSTGKELPDEAVVNPAWQTLIYKPHGRARKGSSFLLSDSDYVEVLTEIDIQRPIPPAVQSRRVGRPFFFVGCRFDDQMLRTFARQIAKRSGEGHIAVMQAPLTRMERRFMDEMNITLLDLPVSACVERMDGACLDA